MNNIELQNVKDISACGSMEKLMQIKVIKETWCQFKLTSQNRQSLLSRSFVLPGPQEVPEISEKDICSFCG